MIPGVRTAAARIALAGEEVTFQRPRRATGPRTSVSVVIPCYNYGQYLDQCVSSALDQSDVDVEVIVVDDASPDGSGRQARAIARRHTAVRAIVHDINRGHISTYNEGLAQATGEFVVLLSADDLLAEGSLGRATRLMNAHPEVGLVYGLAPSFTRVPPCAMHARGEEAWLIHTGRSWIRGRCLAGHNPIRCPEVVMRTSIFQQVGGYRPDLPHGADFAMWLGAATLSDVAYVLGAPQAFYRQHDLNMSRAQYGLGSPGGVVPDLLEKRRCFETIEPGREELVRIARRTLARQALRLASRTYVWGKAGEWPVDDLKSFAIETCAEYQQVPEWRMLQRREAMGDRARRNPSLLPSEAWHRLSGRLYGLRSSVAGA